MCTSPSTSKRPHTLISKRSLMRWMRGRARNIHVHCAANYRVSAFYSLYALRKGLCTEAEANEIVQDIWNPADYPTWMDFIADERARTTS